MNNTNSATEDKARGNVRTRNDGEFRKRSRLFNSRLLGHPKHPAFTIIFNSGYHVQVANECTEEPRTCFRVSTPLTT